VVLVEVDDILEGGTADHRKQMESFYAKFKCGKKINLFELGKAGTRISGIRVCQNKDYTFEWHMNEYADSEMSIINIPRGFKTHTTELSDDYMSQVMSSNGNKMAGSVGMVDPTSPLVTALSLDNTRINPPN
jgi:hypothetical protein